MWNHNFSDYFISIRMLENPIETFNKCVPPYGMKCDIFGGKCSSEKQLRLTIGKKCNRSRFIKTTNEIEFSFLWRINIDQIRFSFT